MADLLGEAAGTAVERAVEDDAGGDAGADREVRQVVEIAEDAALIQADGRGTGIVLDDDRAAESLLQGVAQRVVVPAKIDGEGDGALP